MKILTKQELKLWEGMMKIYTEQYYINDFLDELLSKKSYDNTIIDNLQIQIHKNITQLLFLKISRINSKATSYTDFRKIVQNDLHVDIPATKKKLFSFVFSYRKPILNISKQLDSNKTNEYVKIREVLRILIDKHYV